MSELLQTAFTMNVLLRIHREHSETNEENKTYRFSVVHPLTCGTGDLWGTDAVFLLDFRGPMCQDREAMKDLLEDVTCANGRYSSLYSLNGLFLLLLRMINFISFQGSVTK